MALMPRVQPLLHEAMKMILQDCPDSTATLQSLSEENSRRDLYRKDEGDGSHPSAFQFRLRARQYPDLFDLIRPDKVKYIGT